MLQKNRPLIVLLCLILLVAILHFFGFYFQLYWRTTWFDHVVHILGSIWIVILVFSLPSIYRSRMSVLQKFLISLIAALSVGILWELFEVKTGVTVVTDRGYMLDTLGDLLSDVIGGILGGIYIVKHAHLSLWNNQK